MASALDALKARDAQQTPTKTPASGGSSGSSKALDALLARDKATKPASGSKAFQALQARDKKPEAPTPEAPHPLAAGPRVTPTEPNKPGVITNAKVAAPEESTLSKLGKFAIGTIGKNIMETLFGGPSFSALPEVIKQNTVSASPQKIGESTVQAVGMGIDQYKRVADRADKLVASLDSRKPASDRMKASLDMTTSLIMDAGGAVFNGALEVVGSSPVGAAGKKNLETAMGFVAEKGGQAASYGAGFIPMSEETRAKLDPSIRELGGALAILATFGLAHKAGAKISKIDRFSDTLGMNRVVDEAGVPRVVSPEEVATAFKTASDEAIASGVDVGAKIDVLKAAETTMRQYAELGPERFAAEVGPQIDALETQADGIIKNVTEKGNEAVAKAKDDAVKAVVTEPATPATRKIANNFDPEMQLAFEQELFDMNAKNDPKLNEQAAAAGIKYERINDPTDTRPAYYDVQTGTIKLNEAILNKTLDALWSGQVLKIGEGRLVSTIRKITGESFESLRRRYETELVKHEVAHAKTIDPTDVARLEAALRSGDKATAEKIRVDLEERASKYVIEKSNALTPAIDKSLDAEIARRDTLRTARTQLSDLKFENGVREQAFARYREIIREKPELAGLSFEELRARLSESKYQNVEELLNQIRDSVRNPNERVNAETTRLRTPEDVLAKFQERITEEKRIREDFAKAKAEHATLYPKENLDKRTRKAISRAVRAEIKIQDLEGKNRKLELGKLRERIRARLQKDVMREKFQNLTKKQQARVVQKDKRRQILRMLEKTKAKLGSSNVKKGRYTADVQTKLDEIRRVVRTDRGEAQREIIRTVEDWRGKNPNSIELPADLAERIEILNMAGIKDQNIVQLKRTASQIVYLIREGVMKRKTEMRQRAMKVDSMKENTALELTGKRDLPNGEIQPDLKAARKSVLTSAREKYWWGTALFNHLSKELGRGFYREAKNIAHADALVQQRVHDVQARLTKATDGQLGRAAFTDEYLTKQTDFGMMPDVMGKEIPVRATRGLALELYLRMQDPYAKARIMDPRGNGMTQAMIDRITSLLKPEDKKLADIMLEEGSKQHANVSPVFERLNGVPFGRQKKYFAPLRVEHQVGSDANFYQDAMQENFNRNASVSFRGKQSRTGAISPIKFSSNPVADFLDYVKRSEHYAQSAESFALVQRAWADPKLRNLVEEKYGRSFVQEFDGHLDKIRQGGVTAEQSALNRLGMSVVGNLGGALVASPKVWAGQLAEITRFRSRASDSKVFWKGVREWKTGQAELAQYAPKINTRDFKTASEIVQRFGGDTNKLLRALETGKDIQSIPLEKIDKVIAVIGGNGLFRDGVEKYLKAGHPLEKAKKLAGRDVTSFVVEMQSDRSYLGRSNLETQPGVLRTMTVLRNQPMKVARAGIQAMIDYRKGRITSKQAAQFIVWNNVISPVVYTAVRYPVRLAQAGVGAAVLSALGQQQAADKAWESGKGNFLQDAFMNVLTESTGLFGLGDIVSNLVNNGLFGKNYEYRPQLTDVLFQDISQAMKQATAGDMDEATVLSLRAMSRSMGIGDPAGIFQIVLNSLAAKNKEQNANEKKTPEAKIQAKLDRIQKK